MAEKSKYDQIHDDLWHTDTTKAGTRYERLVAYVMKHLSESDAVVHDIKLRGDSEVKHQIDVTIEQDGVRKRVLIECKDFDLSKDKIGLGIVRDFWGVIDDVHPDEAIVITCNGFTKDAQKYAKSKGIKLAILREFIESDWEGRIKTICFTMRIRSISEPRVSLHLSNQEHLDKIMTDLQEIGIPGFGICKGQPVYLNLPEGRVQINEHVEKAVNDHPRDVVGSVTLNLPFKNATLEVGTSGGVPIEGLIIEFEVLHSEHYFEVTSGKIAKLILQGFGDGDIIVFEEDLRRLKIDEGSGEIHPT